ncbi:MAG: putative ATP/GTP-binding protein [Actinomycetia bacterium]|nr:putative ATP/GTP-binding protein [Actinomycetes bacterium]
MESHRHLSRVRPLALLTSCLLLLVAGSARADGGRTDGDADSGAAAHTEGDSVVVQFTRQADGSGRRTADDGCDWFAVPSDNIQEFQEVPRPPSSPPADGEELYVVWSSCGAPVSYVWLGAGAFDDPAQGMAEELIRRLTVNPSTVDVRPNNRGVTGIPSMFWVEGYDANALTATDSAFGLTVTVTIQLVEVAWDFGDGSPVLHTGLGEAWPERSSVQHNYRDSSGGSPFRVTATLLFQPTYTVNGVAGPALDPIQVPVTRDYVVHQIQAQRTH